MVVMCRWFRLLPAVLGHRLAPMKLPMATRLARWFLLLISGSPLIPRRVSRWRVLLPETPDGLAIRPLPATILPIPRALQLLEVTKCTLWPATTLMSPPLPLIIGRLETRNPLYSPLRLVSAILGPMASGLATTLDLECPIILIRVVRLLTDRPWRSMLTLLP